MTFLKVVLVFGLFYFGVGCATRAPQTELLFSQPNTFPDAHVIEKIEFVDQGKDHCGPATLVMAMNHAGRAVTKDDIAKQVYTPGLQGSLPADMLTASRRQGLLALPVTNLHSMITEVSAGNPVIVFQNLALGWAPQWHYGLVVGYNLKKKKIILHTGFKAYDEMDFKEFERTWKLADYWGLVVLPPSRLAASSGELEHAKAAVGLEKSERFNEAEIAYKKILERWPENLVALIGLGNFAYQNGNKKESIYWLTRAVNAHPESEAAKNNLRIAQQK